MPAGVCEAMNYSTDSYFHLLIFVFVSFITYIKVTNMTEIQQDSLKMVLATVLATSEMTEMARTGTCH